MRQRGSKRSSETETRRDAAALVIALPSYLVNARSRLHQANIVTEGDLRSLELSSIRCCRCLKMQTLSAISETIVRRARP